MSVKTRRRQRKAASDARRACAEGDETNARRHTRRAACAIDSRQSSADSRQFLAILGRFSPVLGDFRQFSAILGGFSVFVVVVVVVGAFVLRLVKCKLLSPRGSPEAGQRPGNVIMRARRLIHLRPVSHPPRVARGTDNHPTSCVLVVSKVLGLSIVRP